MFMKQKCLTLPALLPEITYKPFTLGGKLDMTVQSPIKHVVLLMMENHSFDRKR